MQGITQRADYDLTNGFNRGFKPMVQNHATGHETCGKETAQLNLESMITESAVQRSVQGWLRAVQGAAGAAQHTLKAAGDWPTTAQVHHWVSRTQVAVQDWREDRSRPWHEHDQGLAIEKAPTTWPTAGQAPSQHLVRARCRDCSPLPANCSSCQVIALKNSPLASVAQAAESSMTSETRTMGCRV